MKNMQLALSLRVGKVTHETVTAIHEEQDIYVDSAGAALSARTPCK